MVNLASFWKPEACGQTVLPDRSLLIGQKLAENAKIQKFKCDILSNFQTMWRHPDSRTIIQKLNSSQVDLVLSNLKMSSLRPWNSFKQKHHRLHLFHLHSMWRCRWNDTYPGRWCRTGGSSTRERPKSGLRSGFTGRTTISGGGFHRGQSIFVWWCRWIVGGPIHLFLLFICQRKMDRDGGDAQGTSESIGRRGCLWWLLHCGRTNRGRKRNTISKSNPAKKATGRVKPSGLSHSALLSGHLNDSSLEMYNSTFDVCSKAQTL